MTTTAPHTSGTADKLENYGGGCVWIFSLLMYITLAVMFVLMGISTSEKIFIPLGAILLIVLILFNTWYVYRVVQLKKRIAVPLLKGLQAIIPGKIKWPTLWKFTVSPRYEFNWAGRSGTIRIVKTNRSVMNQLIAKQLETNQAQLGTELNTKYLLPGWKGTLFRLYISWDSPADKEYCFFQKTAYSSSLSNAFIGLTGSSLREVKSGNVEFDQLISCYGDHPANMEQQLQQLELQRMLHTLLSFNQPFASKFEMGKKGIFITTILSSGIQAKSIRLLMENVQKLESFLKE
jgi:hypothetical protein